MVCLWITRSRTLDRNGRLETGRQLDIMVSSIPDSLIKGEIVACFHGDGKQTSTTERLTTRVMYGANNEMQPGWNRIIGS